MSTDRTHRLWRQAALQVPRRRPRRRVATNRPRPLPPTAINHVWAYDFVFDTCASGQTLKCLTIVDEWTRECLAIDVAGGIRSGRVIEVLTQLVSVHGAPAVSAIGQRTGVRGRRHLAVARRRGHPPRAADEATALSEHRHLRSTRVLCQDNAEPLTRQIVQTRAKRAARRAGVLRGSPTSGGGGVHILRHTFCSHLAMRGAPARAIQELAGHADLSMTQRYMHLSPAALDAGFGCWRNPPVRLEGHSVTGPREGGHYVY